MSTWRRANARALTRRISAQAIALVHVARKQCGLDDDAYRDLLEGAAGKRSSVDLTYADLDNVLAAFANLGFHTPGSHTRAAATAKPRWATEAQLELIRNLWAQAADYPNDAGLAAFLQHRFNVARVGDLTFGAASRVVEALKAMKKRKEVKTDGRETKGDNR